MRRTLARFHCKSLSRSAGEGGRAPCGLRALDGYVLYDNQPILGLLRSSGQPLEVNWDGGSVLSIRLGIPQALASASQLRSR